MGLKGKMKKIYKLSCILNHRKPGDYRLTCECFKSVNKNYYEWCDDCKYKKE